MDNQELKNILIGELGKMPFKDKKLIKDEGTIPKALLEKLMLKHKKRKNFNKIALIVSAIFLGTFIIASYWIPEKNISFFILLLFLLMQILNHSYSPEVRDSSKRELIFKLFKTMEL